MLSSIRDTISAGAEVMAVEWEFLSEKYVVQRRKIADLCKLVSMGGIQDKVSKLKDIIAEFRPDIVYVQESPEVCCLRECADLLYSRNGEYQIRETSHCSRLVPSLKKWFPDEYLWVSEHHQRLFADGGTPSSVVEYRPMRRSRPDRVTALRCLGLDPWKTHVLNVGLFTPGKNQGEAFDVARFLPGVLFHFVGNRAENFRGYWEPIIASKPANCVLWDESDDVDKFYSSMDMLLFTSTSELNPLVPIEALSWGMPVLMRNLPVYHGKYDENPLVTYISGDVGETVGILRRRLLPMAA
jgi:glycosyltransferase involved in cell wall biosynthesis